MISTTEYDAPAVWAPLLIAWANEQAEFCEDIVRVALQRSAMTEAERAQARVTEFRRVADRARVRLVDLSKLPDADPMDDHITEANALTRQIAAETTPRADEPPHQLVGFVGWLRALVGHLLPWVSAETWQTCSALMLMDRERAQGRLP